MRRFLVLAIAATAMSAQSTAPAFEAASVKPTARPGRGGVRGGPGTSDPGQITAIATSLRALILRAYDLKDYQLVAPAWIAEERYDMVAKVQSGATALDANRMLQQLLAERFHLAVHRDQKELSGYALTIAKNGPKFRESDSPVTANSQARDKDGYPSPRPDQKGILIDSAMYGGPHYAVASQALMADLVGLVVRELGKPVIDASGLNGRYAFRFHWVSEYVPPSGSGLAPYTPDGPDLPAALNEQLGVRLESRKVLTELLIVDHVEKATSDQ